jgi:hypothetical protein
MHVHAPAIAGALWMSLMLPSPQPQRAIALEAADCSRIDMMFGDEAVGRAVKYTTVPLSVGMLDVQPDANGGVQIERGASANYVVTACVGAGARTAAEAREAAEAVRLTVDGGRVRVENGPRSGSWNVHLIVEAPDKARITVRTANGPIGISGASGEFAATSSNGPIGLEDVRGKVVARASNGPIGVTGSRGDFDVQTDNGPISITLSGQRWEGRLDARAQNGPLRIAVPDDYQSGLEITSSGRSSWNCRIAGCSSARGNDDGRTVRIGGDPVVIRVATANGPVTVQRR